ncbi:MAG: Gldg family protein, partial [Acidobacteriota bacterium]
MDTIKKYLNHIGLALIILALAVRWIWPYRKALVIAAAVLGVAALAVYVLLNLATLKRSLARKSFLYSSNLLLIIVLVLAILVLLNYFLSRHHYRADFTEAKLHSLSDQSVQVLKNLKQDVLLKCFFTEQYSGRGRMENLLKIYAYHSNRIKFEFINPDRNPGLVKRYEVTQDGTTIFESG